MDYEKTEQNDVCQIHQTLLFNFSMDFRKSQLDAAKIVLFDMLGE